MQTEETMRLYNYFKWKNEPNLNKYEKNYIYAYNRKRINQGCKILFHETEQRKQYFSIIEYLSDYYGFRSTIAPSMYEPFLLPGKGYQGAGFFQRLKSILLYQHQIVSNDGKVDLFLKMEKIKLAYMVLKSNLKVNFLE